MFYVLIVLFFIIAGPLLIYCIQELINKEKNKEIEKYNRDDY